MKEILQVTALSGYPDEIGRWLWSMQALRSGTLEMVEGLDQATLDWQGPDGRDNAIGSLLYHIARVEMSWLHYDLLLLKEFPPAVNSDFPFEGWSSPTSMMHVPNVSLADHLGRLERSRSIFLDAFRGMTVADWRRLRSPSPEEDVTPEWVVFHLAEHEAGHQYQINAIKRRARHFFGGGAQ
ncbi:MAG: hypothetical protein JWN15_508 [Firmicutes bacterium]|nr:hypothetical protein [Bacillota bacterium]